MILFALLALGSLTGTQNTAFDFFALTPGGVLIGVVPLVGLMAAAGLCFVIGVALCAYGVVPPETEGN
jgi:hypothetical protein